MNLSNMFLSLLDFIFDRKADVTAAPDIRIKEPQFVRINLTGIRRLPTTSRDNLYAYAECWNERGERFKKRVILNAQGVSSLIYPKKNLSMVFCEDKWKGERTTSIQIGNWLPQDRFFFKASWLDTFRGGLSCATAYKLYDDIVQNDTPIHKRAGLKVYSGKVLYHPDSFPCQISLNGKFVGIYAWQLGMSLENMNMAAENPKHVWFQLETYTEGFKTGNIRWEDIRIWCPGNITDDTRRYIQQFAQYHNELLALEKCSTEETVRQEIAARYDVVSVVNMILHGLITSNIDGFGKNANFLTWDGCKWFVFPYDLDMTFGNSWIASFQFPASYSYPTEDYRMEVEMEKVPYCWIFRYFKKEIEGKYKALRDNGIFTTERILRHLKSWNAKIGANVYESERAKWPEALSSCNGILSEKWELIPTWQTYKQTPDYDLSKSYTPGDICRYDYRLWRAKQPVHNEAPVLRKGYYDTVERVHNWLDERIELLDQYLGYK